MKTILSLLCAMFGMNMANAQYYFTTYGSFPDFQTCNSGITTSGLNPGYMLVGWQIAVGGFQSSNVVWTDLSGSSGIPPYFNKTFSLWDQTTGTYYNSRATEVIQNSFNQHFYVVGWVLINSVYYPYMMDLDQGGNFVSCTVFQYTNATMEMVQITEATAGGTGDMYITTHFDYGQGTTSILVLRVDMAGNVGWVNIYDIKDSQGNIQSAHARGTIESPWPQQSGNSPNELNVFGAARAGGATGTLNPTVLIIDGPTGALAPVPVIQHQHGVDAQYLSCAISNNYGGGFVAAGRYDNGGINNHNALTTNMQPMGATNWSTMHDNGPYPGEYNIANGVKERYSVANQMYETYTSGQIYDMATNMSRMQVLKIDNTGNLINEFVVSSTNNEFGCQLDFDPAGDGLAAFGTLGIPSNGHDIFTAKMCFNGVMPCNETTYSFSSAPVDISIVYPPATGFAGAGAIFKLNATIDSLFEHQQCFSTTLPPGGSNAKTINPTDENTEGIGFNLKQAGSTVSIKPTDNVQQTDTRYLINVYDLAGRNVLSTDLRILPGQQDMVDLDSYGLKRGYYLLVVTNNGRTQSLKVFNGQ